MQENEQNASWTRISVPVGGQTAYEYWEARTVPSTQRADPALEKLLRLVEPTHLPILIGAPFRPHHETKIEQLKKALELVRFAYETVPVYRAKYDSAHVDVARLSSWEDFRTLPVMTKRELQEATLGQTLSSEFAERELYSTRSSGSSGLTLDIRIDHHAMAIDTLQGVRQLYLQSGLRYGPEDRATFVYTVPWLTPDVAGKHISDFVSSLIQPREIAKIIASLNTKVLSLYPSVLESILPHLDVWRQPCQQLVIVHSEQSTREARQRWTDLIGLPVLDEYSSEEATRIALELPCGHYHVCEDAVVAEILNPSSFEPVPEEETGVVVVTNLLNRAMPFIRYVQGDMASLRTSKNCSVQWTQLGSLNGRINDAFLTRDRRLIPAGTILDITYRMMFDRGISINEFLLVQVALARIILYVRAQPVGNQDLVVLRAKLTSLLEVAMQEKLHVEVIETDQLPFSEGSKQRAIRRSFPIANLRV